MRTRGGFVLIYIQRVPFCGTCRGCGDQREGGDGGGNKEHVFGLSSLFYNPKATLSLMASARTRGQQKASVWSKFSEKSFKGDFCFAESVSETLFWSLVDTALAGGQILAQCCCCSPRGVEEVGRTWGPQKAGGWGGDVSSAESPNITCISWFLLLSSRGEEAKVII